MRASVHDRKDEEPISAHKFRLTNAQRLSAYKVCQRMGHDTREVGKYAGDWVRCWQCESEYRTMSSWSPTWKDRDTPIVE